MLIIDLGNENWTLHHSDGRSWPATVPGCAHTDLLRANELPDPWFRDNETKIDWVWRENWTWHCQFELTAEQLAIEKVDLVCEGLDTLAAVSINGTPVLRAENMFRTWRVAVADVLQAGTNTITVRIESPLQTMQEGDRRFHLPAWNVYHPDFAGKSWVRKMGCAFGWDWGLIAPAAGIWRPIRLEAYTCRLENVRVRQEHRKDSVSLTVSIDSDNAHGQKVLAELSLRGEAIATVTVTGKIDTVTLDIDQPQLWWPNGLGEQTLYDLHLSLLDSNDTICDKWHKRIGLRKIELLRNADDFGEQFCFRCNDMNIFAKGANWIPADIFPSRVSNETYHQAVADMAEANMNMVRVWGGGIYEDDCFYDACDERGILVWQDFMFSCATYPGFDKDFLANIREEVRDNVRRLRHHACLALWCGNNELEQGLVADEWTDTAMSWQDYLPIFDHVIPDVIAEEDGVTPYWPCSAHTPGEDRKNCHSEKAGDVHAWHVWFGGKSFESQRQWHYRFISEFGFQSFPEPKSVRAFTKPEDRNLTSWVMDYHQRSGDGNRKIYQYLCEWFPLPKDFDNTLWLTQLLHGLCIQYAVEHGRRMQGQMDGLIYWQLNDLWPGATWSSIDAYGRWKALHFMAKRFFAPIHISIVENRDNHQATVHLSNQSASNSQASVHWQITTSTGKILAHGEKNIATEAQQHTNALTIDCAPWVTAGGTHRLPMDRNPLAPMQGERDIFIWAWATTGGKECSRSLATFVKPKHLILEKPTFTTEIVANGKNFDVTITSNVPAPWTRIELGDHDASYSDNWFHLCNELPRTVTVTPKQSLDIATFEKELKIVALTDHWSTDGP